MKVILLTDVKKVGTRGQIVVVADGFAMNVLIPQKKAVSATGENLKRHEQATRESALKADNDAAKAHAILKELDGKTLEIVVKASPTGTLFKSLHASDIVAEIKKQWGIELPEKALGLADPIKKTGTHEVPVSLLSAKAKISISVS